MSLRSINDRPERAAWQQQLRTIDSLCGLAQRFEPGQRLPGWQHACQWSEWGTVATIELAAKIEWAARRTQESILASLIDAYARQQLPLIRR